MSDNTQDDFFDEREQNIIDFFNPKDLPKWLNEDKLGAFIISVAIELRYESFRLGSWAGFLTHLSVFYNQTFELSIQELSVKDLVKQFATYARRTQRILDTAAAYHVELDRELKGLDTSYFPQRTNPNKLPTHNPLAEMQDPSESSLFERFNPDNISTWMEVPTENFIFAMISEIRRENDQLAYWANLFNDHPLFRAYIVDLSNGEKKPATYWTDLALRASRITNRILDFMFAYANALRDQK